MEREFAGHPLPDDLADKDELDEADEMELHEAGDVDVEPPPATGGRAAP